MSRRTFLSSNRAATAGRVRIGIQMSVRNGARTPVNSGAATPMMVNLSGPGYPGVTLAPGTQVVLGYGHAFGPTKYYEARAGFSRLTESIIDAGTVHGNLAEQLGIPGANAGGAPGLTTIGISGTTGLGDNNGMTFRYVGVLVVWVAVLLALYAVQQYFS